MRAIIRTSRLNYSSPRFDTSDIIQDSIIQVIGQVQLDEKQPQKVCHSWLRSVTLGHLAKHLRFNNAGKRSVKREKGRARYVDLENGKSNPASLSADGELIEIIVNSLGELEPLQRQIVSKRFFQHATYEEISQELNISIYSVRAGLLRALEQLRRKFDADHVETC